MSPSYVQPAQALLVHTVAAPVPHWLMHMGTLGLFFVAALDSSVIPLVLPGSADLLLVWLVALGGHPWLHALNAVAGSVLGGYTTWQFGRSGGEAALQHHVPTRILGLVTSWVERHPILAVFLPALLPPPIPLSPFVLASGALGVSRGRFLVAFGGARCLRYSLVAWLGVAYGRDLVRLWSGSIQRWSGPVLGIFCGVLAAGLCFGIWKLRSARNLHPTAAPMLRTVTTQTH